MLVEPLVVTLEEREGGLHLGNKASEFLLLLKSDGVFIGLRLGVISQISIKVALRALIVLT